MEIIPVAKNVTLLRYGNYDILFSYRTPVAMLDKLTGMSYRTSKKWSQTTTRHINKYGWENMLFMPQSDLDNLAQGDE